MSVTTDFSDGGPGWRERAAVIALVLAAHLAVLGAWMAQPSSAPEPELDMEVSLSPIVPAQPEVKPAPVVPVQQVRPEAPAPTPLAEQPVVQQDAAPEPNEPPPVAPPAQVVAPVEAVQAETDPDYRAAFLNNQVIYPLVARRMGLEGTAIINVEVLANGVSGQVKLQQSSGHFLLDESALRSAQRWSFIPARRGAQPVTKWMTIAVKFSLKDN